MVDSETTEMRPIETYNRPITWAHRIQLIADQRRWCTTIRSLSQRPPLHYGRTQRLPSPGNDCFQLRCRSDPRRSEMAPTAETSIKRTIRRHQLREMVPLADSTIYEMEQRGEFPRRFALSPRCVVWDLAEVEAWLASRRSATIPRAQSPDVRQRRSRPVRSPGPVQTTASKAG